MLIRGVYLVTGRFEDFMKSPTGYNHLLTIGASVALFHVFKNWKFGKEKTRLAAFVCRIWEYICSMSRSMSAMNGPFGWERIGVLPWHPCYATGELPL